MTAETMFALSAPPRAGVILVRADQPTARRNQVVVEVAYSAVNDIDVEIRDGARPQYAARYRRRGPSMTGIEFSGCARSDGARIRAGQRVIGYTHVLKGPRTHAQFVAIDECDLAEIPDDIEDADAAALIGTGLAAIEIVERLIGASIHQRCLVIGAAGGVGASTVQLAAARGAKVVAVASSGAAAWIGRQGASEVRDRAEGWWRTGDQFDAIVDASGVSCFAIARRYLRPSGVYINTHPQNDLLGFVQALASPHRFGWLTVMRSSPAKLDRLMTLASDRVLRPVIDSIYGLDEANAAFDRFRARGKRGRVLLKMAV